jgi:hypothetical protein
LIAIEVEPEYRSVVRSLSGQGPKEESNARIAAGSEVTDLLRWLKLTRRLDSFMIVIGVESEYRFVARSLFEYGPKGEPNALIAAGSEVMNFMRRRRSCSWSSSLL